MAINLHWIGDFIRKDPGLKLLALVLAVLSFHAIRSTTSNEVTMNVTVEVRAEKGVAIMEQDPMTVDVTFLGSKEDIDGLDGKEMKAVVRPKASDPNQLMETVPITSGDIEGAARVRITKIRPSAVHLTFDREAVKLVDVARPEISGEPLRGKVEIDYKPKAVVVHGSQRGLEDMTQMDTEPVDVEGRAQSFTKHVRVLPPTDTWVSQIEPPEVLVRVSIVSKVVERVWTNVSVLAISEPGSQSNLIFDPDTVDVTVRGRAEVLDGLTNGLVKVFVDCVGLDPAVTNECPLSAHLPPGLGITATMLPQTIDVSFREGTME